MTAKEIYENALALSLSHIDEEDDLSFFAVRLFNIMLAELFENNNSLRIKKGEKPLVQPAKIASLEEEVNYEIQLYAPMSYALASKLLQAQEETNLAAIYNNQYVTLLSMVTPAVEMEVV
ncbi:MAG: hypothetical protein E7484_01880 [Ruminococcaceae bacterium]|nr:hypothetical protein [Oscillospiraceae bacterium]